MKCYTCNFYGEPLSCKPFMMQIAYRFSLQIFEIIGFVYQYLKLMRQVSPQEWIFKELQDIGNIDFRFLEEQPQDDYAAELAGVCVYQSKTFLSRNTAILLYECGLS